MAPQTSIRSILAYAGNLLSQVPLISDLPNPLSVLSPPQSSILSPPSLQPYTPLSGAPTCPIDGPISCHNSTPGDSCCFVYPGGRLLLTQFWDREVHAGGSEEDWTAHGLWPDLCDGTYDQYCGMAPRFNDIRGVLESFGQTELLQFMDRYWIAKYGGNAHLWAHEYNKHATCINTLAPACYGEGYQKGMEVVDYFTRAYGLFKMLDTYIALEKKGIVPDEEKKYPLKAVESALQDFSGSKVVLRCEGKGNAVLHEAWYVYFVKGSLQSGEFVPARDGVLSGAGNCAEEVLYLPKTNPRGLL